MADIILEQALYGSHDSGGYQFLARSPGFRDEWRTDAEQLCTGFGERPAGVRCPECVFAQPFGKSHVAVVQVADQGSDDAGRPGALAFRILLVPRNIYQYLGDPFAIAARYPPPWSARIVLPTLTWEGGPLPPRTVQEVQEVLKRPEGPALLGGVQALLDGSRLVFERSQPDPDTIHGLWTLLPSSSRAHLWPASFAFGNALGFDALVVARAGGDAFAGYVGEEQAKDYPEGRYELNLQIAAEAGDQEELDRLFARRTRGQTWRLGLFLAAVLAAVLVCLKIFAPEPPPSRTPRPKIEQTADESRLDLPPAAEFHALSPAERSDLLKSLGTLAEEVGVRPLPESPTPEGLIVLVDAELGTADPKRDPVGDITDGPPLRRLRALLWKHHVPEYRERTLTGGELVERLRQKLRQDGRL